MSLQEKIKCQIIAIWMKSFHWITKDKIAPMKSVGLYQVRFVRVVSFPAVVLHAIYNFPLLTLKYAQLSLSNFQTVAHFSIFHFMLLVSIFHFFSFFFSKLLVYKFCRWMTAIRIWNSFGYERFMRNTIRISQYVFT